METRLEYLKRINESNLTAEEKVEYTTQVLAATDEEVVEAFNKEEDLTESHIVEAKHTHVWNKTVIPWYCFGCGAIM